LRAAPPTRKDAAVLLRGVFVPPFGELADPRRLADLAALAEARGWDGIFLWDHIAYDAPVRAVADPWIALSAIACATERVRLGPMVTPVPRRRVQKLARETATLDHLSGGRLILGAGLGGDRGRELTGWGEEADPRARARLLDEGLDRLAQLWAGEFEPRPLQQPRVPVWLAVRWPNRRPLVRAARWDGVFPIEIKPAQLAQYVDELRQLRGGALEGFDVVVTNRPGTDLAPWEAAGATWCLTGWGPQPSAADVEAVVDAGPAS
jgi:alkanesulfonate monooxygenase SsuD/methylene tetrahydromethanopterin reductase-like flavin-dependent oxidoreductase (luciferase family)